MSERAEPQTEEASSQYRHQSLWPNGSENWRPRSARGFSGSTSLKSPNSKQSRDKAPTASSKPHRRRKDVLRALLVPRHLTTFAREKASPANAHCAARAYRRMRVAWRSSLPSFPPSHAHYQCLARRAAAKHHLSRGSIGAMTWQAAWPWSP